MDDSHQNIPVNRIFAVTIPLNQEVKVRMRYLVFASADKFLEFVEPLRTHHVGMYEHSLRVGIYAHEVWEETPASTITKALICAMGCGHDMGKCIIPTDIIDADIFDEDCRKKMECHCQAGYEYWRVAQYPLVAHTAALHHSFQARCYGVNHDEVYGGEPTELHEEEILAIKTVAQCDFFDALTTRGTKKSLEELTDVMYSTFPGELSKNNYKLLEMCDSLPYIPRTS